jgi:hypothetical protein
VGLGLTRTLDQVLAGMALACAKRGGLGENFCRLAKKVFYNFSIVIITQLILEINFVDKSLRRCFNNNQERCFSLINQFFSCYFFFGDHVNHFHKSNVTILVLFVDVSKYFVTRYNFISLYVKVFHFLIVFLSGRIGAKN